MANTLQTQLTLMPFICIQQSSLACTNLLRKLPQACMQCRMDCIQHIADAAVQSHVNIAVEPCGEGVGLPMSWVMF